MPSKFTPCPKRRNVYSIQLSPSLPDFEKSYSSTTARIAQLAKLACVSHKYGYARLEDWSAGLLETKVNGHLKIELLCVLDYALLSQRMALKEKVYQHIKHLLATDQIEYPIIRSHAEGKTHPDWRALSSIAFYRYAVKGVTRWNIDRELIPPSTRVRLHIVYSTLVDMHRWGAVWEHICGNPALCRAALHSTVVEHLNYYEGNPADFVDWVRDLHLSDAFSFLDSHGSTPCREKGIAAYKSFASDLENGASWEFFENLD